jgi:hypothetical protein
MFVFPLARVGQVKQVLASISSSKYNASNAILLKLN